MANDYNDKVSRVLSLYQRLMEGEVVDKEVEAARYGVSARSIQRDISAINNFFEQETEKSGVINSIEYDKKRGGHYLSQIYRTRLTNSEILAICKILLDSRAFTRERMEHILDILVDRCTPAEGKAIVQDLIKNEEFHYIELTHKSEFVDKMWDIGQAIRNCNYLEFEYRRSTDNEVVKRKVKPVAIMFSEFYFYLTAFIDDEKVRANFQVRTKSWSDTTTFGTTKTQTNTIGDSEAKGEIKSIADGKSLTETTGRSLQISYINKTVQNLLDRIDEQLERLKEGENYGIFASAAYFLAADPMATKMAASSYKGLINGNCTHVESANINSWQDEYSVNIIKKYLRKLQHPSFVFSDENEVTPVSIVSGRELAVQFGLPRKSIPGVSIIETASFGRNIEMDTSKKHRFIEIGNLYHMGREEEGANGKIPVKLDMDSLTMHTFITGSTGKGKSNAIYSLLERVLEKNQHSDDSSKVSFLVIEPAKGEYKDKFGHYKDVMVYGTNKKKMDLLRINPFSFPDDVHVLEHIDRLIEIFNVCWPMYAAMPAVLKDAIERSYINAGWDLTESECKYANIFGKNLYPSFIDVLKMINVVMEGSKYSSDSKGDYTGALCTRVKSLTNGIYGQIFTSDELSNEELFDSNVVVDLSRVGSVETKALVMGLLIMKMQEYRMSSHTENNNGLKHLTVLEEAHNLLKRTSSDQGSDSANLLGKSVEMLANSIAEMRTYGEGFIIADQAPGLLDMAVIRNTNTKIILGLPDLSDRELVGRAASLNDNQIVELSKLKTGVAAVYQNNWLEPILCHIHPCKKDETPYKPNELIKRENDSLVRAEIVDYLMLPAPKKLEVKTDKLSKLEKTVYKLQIASDTKVDLIKYFKEKNPGKIQSLRSKIVYSVFNSEIALVMSNSEKYDMSSWYNMMLEKLEPNLDSFDQCDQDKILAIIANEHAEREKSPDAAEIRENLLKFIKNRQG